MRQVFFELVPQDYIIALVALSTLAAVIASQAVITGVFSLTRQAIQLGYLPRMEIQHTSETAIGQIYIPRVNWILMAGVVALVVGFGSSGALAGAYGLAVTGAMLVDAALATAVAILVWRWALAARRPGVRPAGHARRRLLHRQRAQDPRRRLAAAGGGGLHLLHHHHLAARPPAGRRPS